MVKHHQGAVIAGIISLIETSIRVFNAVPEAQIAASCLIQEGLKMARANGVRLELDHFSTDGMATNNSNAVKEGYWGYTPEN